MKKKDYWVTVNCGYCFNESLIGVDDEQENIIEYCPQCGEYQDDDILEELDFDDE